MGLHPSLKINTAGAKQRSVLTRIERIKDLMKKGLWSEDRSVVGLPKTKILRVKARKGKSKEETAEGAASQPAAAAAAAPAAGAKAPAPSAKAALAKPADKAKK